MNSAWAYALISVILVSLISLIGLFTFIIKSKKLNSLLFVLVSFSVGALLGDTFIHLLPDAVEENGFTLTLSVSILSGIVFFFVLEKFIHWRHCHVPTSHSHPHPLATMNLVGDCFHNFIDGMVIAGSFLAGTQIGIATTLAVILHEIPQEIGDFGILLYGGMKRTKALMFNFLSGLTAVLGALAVLLMSSLANNLTQIIIPFTAGGFIYIAGSDLIPELHKESRFLQSFVQLLCLIAGVAVMSALLLLK